MYVTIRAFAGRGALIGRLVAPVRDGLVPLLRRAGGFRSYCAFASETGHVVSLSVFDDRETALRANAQADAWARSTLREVVADPPEVLAGEALVHDVARLPGGGSPGLFVAVRVYGAMGPREGTVLPMAREQVFPTITGAAGFRRY